MDQDLTTDNDMCDSKGVESNITGDLIYYLLNFIMGILKICVK